jgi:hypothetical protein
MIEETDNRKPEAERRLAPVSLLGKMKASEDTPRQSGAGFSGWLLCAVLLYLLPMLAVVVDEMVLKTFWFAGSSPAWIKDFLSFIYPFWKGM